MSNKKTHKKTNKIKLKKNNKSKRKYKKKGAGQRLSRLRRNQNETTPPSPHTPPGSPPREPSPPTPQLIIDSDDLPVAEASFSRPIVPAVATSNEVITEPTLTAYSIDRIWTVRMIMDDFEFNSIKGPLKQEIRSALLNYVQHKNFIPMYTLRPKKVDDAFEPIRPYSNKKEYVRGELRILVEEWHEWRDWKNINGRKINEADALRNLIDTLKSPKDTEIIYDYGES
jgi:hypothetical protein